MRFRPNTPLLALLVLAIWPRGPAAAGGVELLSAQVLKTRVAWDVRVTIAHRGEGEPFGPDYWSVWTERGVRLKSVHLSKPRREATPFESWMTGVQIPPGTKTLTVRLHDRVHGYEGTPPFAIDLSKPKGDRYEIGEEIKPLAYRRFYGEHVKRQHRRNGDYIPFEW